MSPVCKMADNGRLTADQKVKLVLFYAETKIVVASQRRLRAHFGKRWAPCKETIYRLSLGTILTAYEDKFCTRMSNVFVTIKMCYVYNQWYDISCATLYIVPLLKYIDCSLRAFLDKCTQFISSNKCTTLFIYIY